MQAAQFFPKENQVEKTLEHICHSFGVPPLWQNLLPYFDSVCFSPAENQQIWMDLGNRDYRLGFKIPGLATEGSPNFDFQTFARLIDEEEDIITVKWKKNLVNVFPGDSVGHQMSLISGIPYPEKENYAIHLEKGAIASILPPSESRIKLAVTETSLLSVHTSGNSRVLTKTDILGGSLEDDYFLNLVSPPGTIFADEPLSLRVSNEGVLFSQPRFRLYCAAEKIGDDEFYLPRQSTTPLSATSTHFHNEPSNNPSIVQEDNQLRITGNYGTLELIVPGLIPQSQPLPVDNEICRLLMTPREADVAICQFPDKSVLLASTSHHTTIFATITFPNQDPVPSPGQPTAPPPESAQTQPIPIVQAPIPDGRSDGSPVQPSPSVARNPSPSGPERGV
jgi:hypothetical protein